MDLSFNILIVDDVIDNIQIAMNILKEENYNFSFATSGEEAITLLEHNHFDLVLLDIMMPGMDGYEVCRRIQNMPEHKDTPVVFLTAKSDIDSVTKAFSSGGIDYITKPFHPEELIARIRTHLELYMAKEVLKHNNLSLETRMEEKENRLLSEIEETQKELIFTLSELMGFVSDETGQHIKRVAEFSRLLAHYHPALSKDDEKLIYLASPMHDIGKIMVPQDILHKATPLTPDEIAMIKIHTTRAYELLNGSSRKLIKTAAVIAHEHHEYWDGNGYPKGLRGEQISIFGRIVAIADVFDALTHDRSYKKAWPVEEAIEYIISHAGTQFDPTLVKIFQEHVDEFIAILEASS